MTISAVLFYPTTAGAQTSPDLTGHWRLNPALSQLPPELGFDADYFQEPAGTERESSPGGTRSRRGSSGRYGKTRNSMPRPESADEARRLRQLTDPVNYLGSTQAMVDRMLVAALPTATV